MPDVEGDRPAKKKFKAYPIGFFHIDIAEVRTEQGKLHMFVAIDRTSKFAFVELHEKAPTAISREFLLRLIAAVPYKIHTVLTDILKIAANMAEIRTNDTTAFIALRTMVPNGR